MRIYHLHINSTGEDFYYTTLMMLVRVHRIITPSYATLKKKLKNDNFYSKKCNIKKSFVSHSIRLLANKKA